MGLRSAARAIFSRRRSSAGVSNALGDATNAGVTAPEAVVCEVEAKKGGGEKRVDENRRESAAEAPTATAAAAAAAAVVKDECIDNDGLTAFEREREAHIARNKARMEALNIKTLGDAVGTREKKGAAPSTRGIAGKRTREKIEASVPTRRSSRARNIAPELASGVDRERRDGSVILADGATYYPTGELTAAPVRTRPSGDVKLDSENGSERTDAAFIETLKKSMGKFIKTAEKPTTASVANMTGNKLKLRECDVAKCTPKGVTHLDFSPDDSMLLVASGDKEGHIGLWRVDQAETSSSVKSEGVKTENDDDEDDDDDDGVLYYKAHGAYISHCKWGQGALRGKLLTSAYDGAVRVLDPERGVFQETVYSEEDEFSACDQFSNGHGALVCDNVGNLHQLDMRTGKFTSPSLSIHEKKINTVHIDPGNEHMFATSTHQLVSVWDVRKLKKNARAVYDLPHAKSSQAAYWNPNGSGALLTTCYDDALRVWHPSTDATKESLKIKHNNQTGRWVLPFRAIWSAAGDGVLCGSMQRSMHIFNPRAAGPALAAFASADHMTAIGSRLACHRYHDFVAAGTASGRIHVFRA